MHTGTYQTAANKGMNETSQDFSLQSTPGGQDDSQLPVSP